LTPRARRQQRLAFAALLFGSSLLALGPWLVRLAGVGPVAAGFWRLGLALPFLFVAARMAGQPVHWPGRPLAILIAFAAFFFAADLAAWHTGIHMTKLGNATLFGNISSFAFAAWGLWLARRWPSRVQAAALILAAVGAGMLMGSSAELSARNLRGDLYALAAGLLYTGYLIAVERGRGVLAPIPLLFLASAFGAAMLLPAALLLGEQIVPSDWTFVLMLAVSSQVLGQGLLVYAIGALPPFVVGLTLLTQPAISAFVGWAAYGEMLSALDWLDGRPTARRCLRSTGSARQPSPQRWCWCGCPNGVCNPCPIRRVEVAMDERPSPLQEIRDRLALAVGENAVFDGWTQAAVDSAGRRRRSTPPPTVPASTATRRGSPCPRTRPARSTSTSAEWTARSRIGSRPNACRA
jgi:drug/metabolite transporter (DMT)-like permease